MTDEGCWGRQDVSAWVVLSVEQSGSSRNTWLEEPDTDLHWLHKDTVIPRNGLEQGEDWSEVFSTQIASALGIPRADTRLCTRSGRRGTLSLNIRPKGFDLNDGAVALKDCPHVTGYHPHTEEESGVDPDRPGVRRPGHSLQNIRFALDGMLAPPGFEGPDALDAFDMFSGYMVFDALVANRDRHEQNWAVLTPQLSSFPEQLAPTYDHASSLGYNLRDSHRERLLEDSAAFEKWASKGTAYRFEHAGKPATLVDHAVAAIGMCSPEGADYWHRQIADVDLDWIYAALRNSTVPEMSVAASRFVIALLQHNHERLGDAI